MWSTEKGPLIETSGIGLMEVSLEVSVYVTCRSLFAWLVRSDCGAVRGVKRHATINRPILLSLHAQRTGRIVHDSFLSLALRVVAAWCFSVVMVSSSFVLSFLEYC